MPYAHEKRISQAAVEGGVEITQQQYDDALDAMVNHGKEVTIDGGFAIRNPRPSEHYVWESGEWVDRTPEPEPAVPVAADVDAEHDRRAALGKTFTLAGYGEVPLEGSLRVPLEGSLRTQTVLLALKDTARDLQSAGVTAPVLFFTDRDNGDHNLTPAQVMEMVDKGKAYMQALHEAKRMLKAVNPIPADYADDSYWPAV